MVFYKDFKPWEKAVTNTNKLKLHSIHKYGIIIIIKLYLNTAKLIFKGNVKYNINNINKW